MTDPIAQMLADQAAAEAPFAHFPDEMPSARDLSALVIAPGGAEEDAAFDDFAARSRNLARGFAGRPRLHLVHAQCVTLLRRRAPPEGTAALFHRLWAEHGGDMAAALPLRWLISAATTFADHGSTASERQAGEGLSTLFAMLKLSETERLFSGFAPETPFRPGRSQRPLPMSMQPFAIHGGDLDRALLARIWRAGTASPATDALTRRLLCALMDEPRGLFARLAAMRQRRNSP